MDSTGTVAVGPPSEPQRFAMAHHPSGFAIGGIPGEMKTILNQVIEAEKAAQANLIKRREETAAARSQANTAKLLATSPARCGG